MRVKGKGLWLGSGLGLRFTERLLHALFDELWRRLWLRLGTAH